MSVKACEGGCTIEDGDMVKCVECETAVRWDLSDHPFFGFQNCSRKAMTKPYDSAVNGGEVKWRE